MVKATPYVPVLKTKQGELASLAEVAVKDRMHPLLELVADDRRPLQEHLYRTHTRLAKAFTNGERFYVDVCSSVDGLAPTGGKTLIEHVFTAARTEGFNATPVTRLSGRLGQSLVYQDKVRAIAADDELGVCLRISERDFDVRTLTGRVDDLIEFLDVDVRELDVVIDLESIAINEVQRMALAVEAVIASLPRVEEYRSLTVVSSGFPQNLGECERDKITRIPRADWTLYETLLERDTLRRTPAYGDYGIQHPTLTEFDPVKMRMSANIRYTGERDYVVSKGRMIAGNGWGQTQDLAHRLVNQPEFRGATFSAAESYIATRAAGANSAGSATTWRRVGTTQHLTLAVAQYATVGGP